ncbi:MAG: DUF1640 domain-containing protein [Alphaproteobacteria bacterium]|nr:DUF1640 domain-containing protein [Alphaproteobacteria bacterium]
MSSTLAFDTHKFVKDLTKTGMKTEQAEVLANHYASLLNDRLATKEDIRALGSSLWIKLLMTQMASAGFIIAALQYLN